MSLTDYRSLYDKDFIGAWDLTDGDLTVTIKKCIGGSLTAPGGRKSKKPVVYMTHTEKGFALNATNGKTIAALYGNHVEKWAGKQITLYKSMTRSPQGDGDVECIRVRPAVPRQQSATAPAGHSPVSPSQEAPAAVAPINAAAQEPRQKVSGENGKFVDGPSPDQLAPDTASAAPSVAPPDDGSGGPGARASTPAGAITDDQALALENALDAGGKTLRNRFMAQMAVKGIKSVTAIPADKYAGLMKWIGAQVDKQNAETQA